MCVTKIFEEGELEEAKVRERERGGGVERVETKSECEGGHVE